MEWVYNIKVSYLFNSLAFRRNYATALQKTNRIFGHSKGYSCFVNGYRSYKKYSC